jgi:hypothetical protein
MKDLSTPLIDAAREQRERFWAEADAAILAMPWWRWLLFKYHVWRLWRRL